MGRNKKFVKMAVPLVGWKLKLDRRMFATLLGVLFYTVGALLFLSFSKKGEALVIVHGELTYRFGGASLLIPIFLLLAGSHFFQTKKLKFITYNVTVGFLLLSISLMGVLKTGQFGQLMWLNLISDFSLPGAIILLFVTFLVGLIFFFNTSLDIIILFVVTVFNHITSFFSERFFGKALTKKMNKGSAEFIQDIRPAAVPAPGKPAVAHPQQSGDELHMKAFSKSYAQWKFPPITLLADSKDTEADYGDTARNSDLIERTLDSFGIRAQVSEINKGPTVSQYALQIAVGTKLSKITTLGNDLALALAAPGMVRIEAPIPGRALVGIEIPNKKAQVVTLRSVLESPALADRTKPLLVPLGYDVSGQLQVADISSMPHALVAGTTGSGKSVLLTSWITTLMMRTTPEQVRLILVDPKRVEFSSYNGAPHLMTEVIVDPKKIISALQWTVNEMDRRYKVLAEMGTRNIIGYNGMKSADAEPMPYIVFIIDELADLMLFASSEVEDLITRIAQMARAVGIHLILATQRPSVDVITGLMKSNIPTRVAFNVPSLIDSRVMLDTPGAEKLLGRGDMLYLAPDKSKPHRIQASFVSEKEVHEVMKFLKTAVPVVHYTEEVTEQDVAIGAKTGGYGGGADDRDSLFEAAIKVMYEGQQASTSFFQRRLKVGYSRAARILDELEAAGYVGPSEKGKAREILHRSQSTE